MLTLGNVLVLALAMLVGGKVVIGWLEEGIIYVFWMPI